MKHVEVQHCHNAQWHDGLKCSGKAGMPFRLTPSGELHSSTPCLPVGYWSPMDCEWVSSGSQSMSENCAPHSVWHSGYCKLAACWMPHETSKVQQRHRYAVAQVLLDRYQRESDDFLGRIVAVDETWARSYEPNLKCQSKEWKHPGSPRPRKLCPIQCAVKVMFIVAYDIDGVILHHTVSARKMVNTAYYCMFL